MDQLAAEEGLSDAELFALARKHQSVRNLQPLVKLAMKAILNNFEHISSNQLEKLPSNLKTEFLDLLLLLTKQRKSINLSQDQRVALIKGLLHENVKRFDFAILDSPKCVGDKWSAVRRREQWDTVFDEVWVALAAKCPNLLQISEKRPLVTFAEVMFPFANLNKAVFIFSKLLCLETNSDIHSGSIEEICTNLKQLKRLKISYRTGNLANVSDLRQLENLEELQLHMITHANDDNFGIHIDKEIKDFNKNFFRVMPKLKVYNFLDINYILNYTLYLNGLEKMTPCTLEQFAAKLWSKNDFSHLVTCMPNLRHLIIDKVPVDSDLQLMKNLENLTSLTIESVDSRTIQLLSVVGPKLKELALKSVNVTLLGTLLQCPNLETLNIRYFDCRTTDLNIMPLFSAENLKLKKFVVEFGDFSKPEGFLPAIFKAPLLEEIKLETSEYFCDNDLESIISCLKMGSILQNLTYCNMKVAPVRYVHSSQMDYLAKHIVSFCPKLETAKFAYSKIDQFLNEVKRI